MLYWGPSQGGLGETLKGAGQLAPLFYKYHIYEIINCLITTSTTRSTLTYLVDSYDIVTIRLSVMTI